MQEFLQEIEIDRLKRKIKILERMVAAVAGLAVGLVLLNYIS